MDTSIIKQLRELTGAGIVDAKKALTDADGDVQRALNELRKKGIVKAAGKSERATRDGLVHAYIHAGGKVGTLVEVLCETDFVARTPQFQEFVHDVAMQIAAANPLYVSPSDVPPEVVAKEKEIAAADIHGKPASVVEKILAGRLDKFYADVCLLRQPWIKDEDQTIEDYLKTTISKLGENIQIRRFSRFTLGE